MPSPITPAQICETIPAANADLCVRLRRFWDLASRMCDFFSWMLDSDGSLTEEFITEITSNTIPPGTLISSATVNMGTGWLLCNGAAVSRTTYASLFLAIGTRYGAGDNSTTFNLPDARGRSLIGAGLGSGLTNRDISTVNVGSETVTMTLANLINHQHDILSFGAGATGGDGGDILNEPDPGPDRTHQTEIEGGGDPPTPMDIVHPCLIAYVFIKT